MDFKIKIDLSSQSIINETPKNHKKAKKRKRDNRGKSNPGDKLITKSRKLIGGDAKEKKDEP